MRIQDKLRRESRESLQTAVKDDSEEMTRKELGCAK
jgi:hypothetical protein